MLSLAKVDALGGRTGRYYTDSVASGAEDYYAGRGESAGVWMGAGAARLWLEGEVSTADFHAVLNGRLPKTGDVLRDGPRRADGEFEEGVVRGFDLTFSAPKSVSVLWAAGDDHIAAQIQRALDVATAEALAWLEQQACVVRRGKGGAFEFAGAGFVAVGFRHRTSRAQDPQLHTHVVVSNMAEGPDKRYTALRGQYLYRHGRTAGFVFQASLRDQLTQRLGVVWEQSRTPGVCEIAVVPSTVCDAFSTRRREIEAALLGLSESAGAAQVAALATRPAKRGVDAEDGLRRSWQMKAAELGFDAFAVANVLNRERVVQRLTDDELDRALTREHSTFDEGALTRTIAAAATDGASLPELRRRVEAWQSGPSAVKVSQLTDGAQTRLAGEDKPKTVRPAERWTTLEHLSLERHLVKLAAERRGASAGVVDEHLVDAVLATAPTATRDQQAMVRALCGRGDGVHVVRASAGAGKTWTMELARRAWEAQGYTVVGVAQARRAALELRDQAGIIDAMSIAALEAQLDRGTALPSGVVLVVDEAAMVDTRTTARLADRVAAVDGLLVLCGDDHQIREIGAGGAFSGLARRLGATTLTGNRRQVHEVDRLRERLLRLDVPEAFFRSATEDGELVLCTDVQKARELLVAEWLRTVPDHQSGETIMLARSREDVTWLNAVACSVLRASAVDAQRLEGPDGDFAIGDWVIARRNDGRLGVVNGQRGTVHLVDLAAGTVTLRDHATDALLELPESYINAGHLEHAYALTAHLAQGMSVERAHVLGSASPERGWTYSALTRHREDVRLYVVAPLALQPEVPTELTGDLRPADTLGQDGTKAMALDTLPDGSRAQGLDELRERQDQLRGLVSEGRQARAALEALEAQVRALPAPATAFDRAKLRRWQEQAAEAAREPILGLDLEAVEAEARTAARDFDRRLDFELQRAVAVARVRPPAHVGALLGPRPEDLGRSAAWDRAAWSVEWYRLRYLDQRQRIDLERGLGDPPLDPTAREHWHAAVAAAQQVREIGPQRVTHELDLGG